MKAACVRSQAASQGSKARLPRTPHVKNEALHRSMVRSTTMSLGKVLSIFLAVLYVSHKSLSKAKLAHHGAQCCRVEAT
jgi:hypothetical protein